MYQVYNRENGWHIFTERRLAAFLGRLFTHYDGFRNMTVSVDGSERVRIDDWLHRYLPPPDAAPYTSASYTVRTAGRPSHIISTSPSYYCALLCMVRRNREEREALVVQIEAYKLGDPAPKTRTINAQTFYSEFQHRLIQLVRDEKEMRHDLAHG